jgi:hypothetical protein
MIALLAWAVLFAQPASTSPSIEPLLTRVEHYLSDYEPRLSHCVAREEYLQQMLSPGGTARRITADFLFLRAGAGNGWLGVRSVLELNGRRQPDTGGQLKAVASATPAEVLELARTLAQENARYNLGISRTVNVPTLILGWLRPGVRRRLRFSDAGTDSLNGVALRKVDFEEIGSPTLIQTGAEDLRSSGTIWVEPATGQVWQTLLRNQTQEATYSMRVRYQIEPRLGILVPVTMEETIRGPHSQRGMARYSDYRRFGVTSRIK